MSMWRKLVAAGAALAVTSVAASAPTAADDHDAPPVPAPASPDGPTPPEASPNPFDDVDLSDPLAAREEVQRRLGETAAASEVVTELVAVARTELAAAQERSTAANEWLANALAEVDAARETAERAEQKATDAAEEAVEARDDARDALVDAYITPPSADPARVSVLSLEELNDSSFAHGLLASRAERLTEVVDAADAAEEAAEDASQEAARASRDAEAAAAEATAAAESAAAAAEETGRRLADLQLFESMVAARVDSLAMVDALLERVVAQREAAEAAAGGPPVQGSEVAAVGGTGIRVHRSVVDAVAAMLMAAAADGVVLDGSGWRTTESQVALRQAHCGPSPEQVYLMPSSSCSPPTARPGSSMHERGLAIDFLDCASRETVCYQWLSANAHRFGFFNLPSEPWHWSVNGR